MLGVEARSALPHHQHDGGNLPGQSQTRHLRPDALGQQSSVELLKRTRPVRGHNRRALKQILQIVIAVSIQSAKGALFLHSFELPVDTTVIGAALRLDAKTTVSPQLPLGTETVRSLQNAKQYG
jgi:hypothetical protein